MTDPSAGATDLLERWLAHLGGVRGRSAKTLAAYRADVASYLGFMAGPPVIGFVAKLHSLTAALYLVVVFAATLTPAEAGRGSPSARAASAERTQRLRYHSARPPRRRTPCTIPSPMNQCSVPASTGPMGFGPLRTYRPSRCSGMRPVTRRRVTVSSDRTGA